MADARLPSGSRASALTRELAAFAVSADIARLPAGVAAEAARAFLNWMGCALGGSGDPAVSMALACALDDGAHLQASVIGRRVRTSVGHAALLNCLSSTVLSFDDTHLATVTHPTGPVAAAIFAMAQKRPATGTDFIAALTVGMEIECRLSNLLLTAPARAEIGWFVTGISGPIGAAAALGRLLRFDEPTMVAALGLAANQASGFRANHGSMAAFLVPANAARNGVAAAQLAERGVTAMDHALEAPKGFVDVFGKGGEANVALEGLGSAFELLSNAYKPYPAGIVVHPATDACLDIAERLPRDADIASVRLRVHPLALDLCGRRHPTTPVEAQLSVFHWAAAALVQRSAGIAQLDPRCIDDPAVQALRERIVADADADLRRDEAHARVELTDGTVLDSHVPHARGSLDRPLTDAELDAKFRSQAGASLAAPVLEELLLACRDVARLPDVAARLGALIDS